MHSPLIPLGDSSNPTNIINSRVVRDSENAYRSTSHVYKSPTHRPAGIRNSVRSTRWANSTTLPQFSGVRAPTNGSDLMRNACISCFCGLNTEITAYLSDSELMSTFYTIYKSRLTALIVPHLSHF